MGRVLSKIREEGAAATVIVPYWTSQYWWPALMELADDALYFPSARDLFMPGDKGSALHVGAPSWAVLAVRINERPRS